MEIVHPVVAEVVAKLVISRVVAIAETMATKLWEILSGANRTQAKIRIAEGVQMVGEITPDRIMKAVEDEAKGKSITDDQKKTIAEVFVTITRNARFHTLHNTKLQKITTFERFEDLILKQPRRCKGEEVSPRTGWFLEEFLGMGGFGEVWLGSNILFPHKWAFKFFTDATAREWLKNEGTALFAVNRELGENPNIIGYNNVAIDAEPYPYLALEYASGGSLEDWILQPSRDLTFEERDNLISAILDGLSSAHEANIYHLDLKPANILIKIGEDDELIPLIADFGLSQTTRVSTASSSSANRGLAGTPMYLPPEAFVQGETEPAMMDVFALGVTWYQLLVGRLERPPYDFAEQLRSFGIPSRTINLISRCLAHPRRRFDDAVLFRQAFDDRLPSPDWDIPEDCYDVGPLAAAFFDNEATRRN